MGVDPVRDLADRAILHLNAATVAHAVGEFGALEFPRVLARQPVIGHLDLTPVDDGLAEHAIVVANAITHARHTQGRHRIEETGGQPAQTAIAQCGIGLQLGQRVVFDAEIDQGLTHRALHVQRQNGVGEGTADQEFH